MSVDINNPTSRKRKRKPRRKGTSSASVVEEKAAASLTSSCPSTMSSSSPSSSANNNSLLSPTTTMSSLPPSTSDNNNNDSSSSSSSQPTLWWHCEEHVPIASEEVMIQVLVKWGAKERGMIKDQPPFRVAQIRKQLRKAPGLRLDQALSLRRHHIKLLNPFRPMPHLRLGQETDIRESAEIFERVVEAFLTEKNIPFINDEQQRATTPFGTLTPDFLLPTPVNLKKFRQGRGPKHKSKKRQVVEERRIHWIEVKMFYGASTIPAGTKGAVGTILPKVSKYVPRIWRGSYRVYERVWRSVRRGTSGGGGSHVCAPPLSRTG